MKKIFVAAVLLSATGLAQADYRFSPADDSSLSKLCVAVAGVEPGTDLQAAATAAGVSPLDLDSVRCNGHKLYLFAGKYAAQQSPASEQPVAYSFAKSDENPETRLCHAVVTSEAEFRKVKELYFSDVRNPESEIACNGIPLKKFALKYRSPAIFVSQR